MERIVVAIDPAVTAGEDSDETGIVICGRGVDGHGYVLRDLSCRLSPEGWARRAIGGYREFHADRIVAEVNNGGDMVESTVRMVDANVSFRKLHASRGKVVRAEPIAALYEQGKVHHVGSFDQLEDQMCLFTADNVAGNSPDRVDALVWALTELFGGPAYGLFNLWKQQAAAMKEHPPSGHTVLPAPDYKGLAKAQKEAAGWPRMGQPAGRQRAAKAAPISPVCSTCGNSYPSVYTDAWHCNVCQAFGRLDSAN